VGPDLSRPTCHPPVTDSKSVTSTYRIMVHPYTTAPTRQNTPSHLTSPPRASAMPLTAPALCSFLRSTASLLRQGPPPASTMPQAPEQLRLGRHLILKPSRRAEDCPEVTGHLQLHLPSSASTSMGRSGHYPDQPPPPRVAHCRPDDRRPLCRLPQPPLHPVDADSLPLDCITLEDRPR
jgi:hypothetical protein